MNRRTMRALFKWSFAVNVAFFALAYADYSLWQSRGMITILAFYAAFLVALIILLILNDGPRYQRLEFYAPKGGSKTVIYRRP